MDDEITNSGISDTITCSELDRRQYENDLELLRIELESKKLELETNQGPGSNFSLIFVPKSTVENGNLTLKGPILTSV